MVTTWTGKRQSGRTKRAVDACNAVAKAGGRALFVKLSGHSLSYPLQRRVVCATPKQLDTLLGFAWDIVVIDDADFVDGLERIHAAFAPCVSTDHGKWIEIRLEGAA
jgi:hypothetical protein